MNSPNHESDMNYKYLIDNWDELYKKYPNKYIIIVAEEVVGFFDTYDAAAEEAVTKYGPEEFLVHHVVEPKPINFIFVA